MLDIKQEIEILLLKKRLSMRKIVTLMKDLIINVSDLRMFKKFLSFWDMN